MKNTLQNVFVNNPGRILVLQLGGIGDLVLSVPALKALRARFPKAFIAVLVIGRSASLIEKAGYVDAIYSMDIRYTNVMSILYKFSFIKLARLVWGLRKAKFDMIINLENISSVLGSWKMALLLWLIGPSFKVGRDTDSRGFFLDLKVPDSDSSVKHEVEANLSVIQALGAGSVDTKLELPVNADDEICVENMLLRSGIGRNDMLIGFNPGAFNPSRRWFELRWAQLGDELVKKYGCKIVIVGHRAEFGVIDGIKNLMDNEAVVFTRLSLGELHSLIRRMKVFVTNDSGPMHMAAAAGVPIAALFGPGDINKFSPYCDKEKVVIVRKDVDCRRPCYNFRCRNRKCMDSIGVADVMTAVDNLYKR